MITDEAEGTVPFERRVPNCHTLLRVNFHHMA